MSPAILNILYITPVVSHLDTSLSSPCDTGVICSSNYYLLNMMSVTKNLNKNQLQQVEMRLCHVYFHHICNTMWSTAHASCIILWTFEDIARSYMKTLAYTTGTTSKHQRATWPELYPKSIVFLRIVMWHMRVFSHLPNVWGYGEGMLHAMMLSKTMKKRISTPNFETSSHQYVTAKKPIGNMYFMYVDMA